MQAVESQTLILYHTDLRGQWPAAAARAFAARLPYARRLAANSSDAARASLAGAALAVRALSRVLKRAVQAGELAFVEGHKPQLRMARAVGCVAGAATRLPEGCAADFSISHSGPWVGCAALPCGRIGFDIEEGRDAGTREWVLREAALKATGEGLRALAAARTLEAQADLVRWRDAAWHVRRLEVFAGAVACILSSVPIAKLEMRAVPLADVFAP
jgi:phosphopantetheinyl transferase